jgi:voltage-gated potassium channel
VAERKGLNRTLFWLYEGNGRISFVFRWLLLILDVLAVIYFLSSPFEDRDGHHWVDYLIGVFFAVDLAARFYIARHKSKFWLDWMVWVDLVLIGTSFVPFLAANFAFLRVLRVLRAIRRFTFIRHRGEFWSWITRNERIFDRVMNLAVFVFVSAGVIWSTQAAHPKINSYFDALYFAVTTLTSTGYGDITLETPLGRVLSMVMMILGLTLFLRLLREMIAPSGPAEHACQRCGLARHDRDAVHCKHCGDIVHIRKEGAEF